MGHVGREMEKTEIREEWNGKKNKGTVKEKRREGKEV